MSDLFARAAPFEVDVGSGEGTFILTMARRHPERNFLGIERLLSARARHPLQRVLVVAWLAVCLIFLAAYLGLGLVVRYVYFAARGSTHTTQASQHSSSASRSRRRAHQATGSHQ